MRLNLLLNPGVALLAVALVLQRRQPVPSMWRATLKSAFPTCLAISLFIVLSQLLLHTGMIQALANTVVQNSSRGALAALSPLFGMVSGFVTGSNTGGNALLIGMQATMSRNIGAGILLAAVHNSACGHAVFASVPILVLAIAVVRQHLGEQAVDNAREAAVLSFTLRVAGAIYVAILLSTTLMLQFMA